MTPIPDVSAGPDTKPLDMEGKVDKRAEEVFKAANFYLQALISKDPALIDIAFEQWDEVARKGDK